MSQTIHLTTDDPPEFGCKQLSVSLCWYARERSTAAVSAIYPGRVVDKAPGLVQRCCLILNTDNPGFTQAGLTLLFTCKAKSLALHILLLISFLLLVLNISQINLQGYTLLGIIVHKSEIMVFTYTCLLQCFYIQHIKNIYTKKSIFQRASCSNTTYKY